MINAASFLDFFLQSYDWYHYWLETIIAINAPSPFDFDDAGSGTIIEKWSVETKPQFDNVLEKIGSQFSD